MKHLRICILHILEEDTKIYFHQKVITRALWHHFGSSNRFNVEAKKLFLPYFC